MRPEYLEYLPDEFRDQAIQLYFAALKYKLEPILGIDGRGQAAISTNLGADRCLVAICDQQLAGILGIQTKDVGFLNPPLKMLVKLYGIFGGILRMCGLALLHHPSAYDELYIDGVAVTEQLRGVGIGSGLFNLVEKVAWNGGFRKISLEIIDTNHKAKALYKRLGFVKTKQRTLWPFNLIFKFPFKSAIQMVKPIC